ncbi:MAG: energy-coupled thiamine transporter ThiT [Oscillospiraceae bacterium]|nr:energy-coupled thiamine transporter ThiT [Oscillospiraceae bacterium]
MENKEITQRRKMSGKTMRLVLSGVMLALATVLSLSPFELPFGGTVTLASMVPIIFICRTYGFRWGMLSATAYGLIQMILGAKNFSYVTTLIAVVAVALFDYIAAYGFISLSALTRKMKNSTLGIVLGVLIACTARYICHVVVGAVVWKQWASLEPIPEFLHGTAFAAENTNLFFWTYSAFYNASFMLPETIITLIAAVAIFKLIPKKIGELGNTL